METIAEAKDPFTRLLDLMAGWGEYVEKDEAEHHDTVSSADVYDAYQSVATFAEPYWDSAPEVQEMAVRHFVDTRLLPLLLGKVKP
jgi:hypothetical protein